MLHALQKKSELTTEGLYKKMYRGNEQESVIVLSPHSDDVAFSISGLIMKILMPYPLHVVTVFSISACTASDLGHPVHKITDMRKREDECFFRSISSNIKISHMDLLDAPLRLDIKEDRVFSASPGVSGFKETMKIYHHINTICRPNNLVIAPLAIGAHIDHLIVRNTALKLSDDGYPVIFYEDLPYSGNFSNIQLEHFIKSIQWENRFKLVPAHVYISKVLKKKIQKISQYTSQMSDSIVGRIVRHAHGIGHGIPAERIWVSANAFAKLKKINGDNLPSWRPLSTIPSSRHISII